MATDEDPNFPVSSAISHAIDAAVNAAMNGEAGDGASFAAAVEAGKVKGPWSPDEDVILGQLVAKFGARNWSLIARGTPGRSGKSCRLRWKQLDPAVKRKPFTDKNGVAKDASKPASEGSRGMDHLSNAFSLLDLDVDDDHLPLPSTGGKRGSQGDSSSANGKSGKGQNAENGNHRGKYKSPLVWIDLEMTGLDVEVDRILEIACIITDGRLTKSVEGPDLIIHQPQECLDKMNEWCQSHHGDSGLTVKVQQSTINESDAEEEVITFVKKHIGNSSSLLAGNSVYMDFAFLKKYMPKLASLFSHVLVDVSSVRSLCIRWFPKAHEMAPAKEKKHRAMEDIRESIAELKYLKKTIFKPKLRK